MLFPGAQHRGQAAGGNPGSTLLHALRFDYEDVCACAREGLQTAAGGL